MMREAIYRTVEYDEEHKSAWSTSYDVFMLAMILMSIVPLMFREQTPLLVWFDRVSVSAFIVDYLLRWATADYRKGRQGKVQPFLTYPFSYMAVLDLLTILPSIGVMGRFMKVLRFPRLLKTLRVFRFLR